MLRPYGTLLLQIRPAWGYFGHAQDKRPLRRRFQDELGAESLEGGQVADGADYVFGLGEDGFFEFGLVGAEGVGGGDAADGGVEVFE